MELEDIHGWLPATNITLDAETEVLVHNKDGQYFLASYEHENGTWYDSSTARLIPNVTHYQDTPPPPVSENQNSDR